MPQPPHPEDSLPRLTATSIAPDSVLVRAARPVLEQVRHELDGAPAVLLLADQSACIVDVQYTERSVRQTLTDLGVAVGVQAGEDQVGPNALGTPVVTGRGALVRGSAHFMAAFAPFTCYGHPIVHPVTGQLEGVFNLGCRSSEEHPLLRPLARRVVRDIQERLRRDTSHSRQRLLAAFHATARRRGRAVLALGQGLVLSSPAALDLLAPADHALVRDYANSLVDSASSTSEMIQQVTLSSGRTVRLHCTWINVIDGVLVHLIPEQNAHRPEFGTSTEAVRPLLIVGEPGSGRTTEARRATGSRACALDARDVDPQSATNWAKTMVTLLETDGPAVVVENVHLLSEQLGALLARCLRITRREVVLTSTPGDHLDGVHAPLVAACAARRDLLPLRRRRHEIPRLARQMLADAGKSGRVRLTSETQGVLAEQPWPGNLSELRRVIRLLTEIRSAGDIIPSDLPISHRGTAATAPASPFRQAERDIIVAAIDAAGGNKFKAARALGVSRTTLYNRMRALQIY